MRVLVLGKGSIGQRHFNNLQELGHEVRSYDPVTDGGSEREGRIRWSQAVVIASPTPQHYQDIIDCQRIGKLIFCEKPLVSSRLDFASVKLDLILMAGYNLRFHSCVKRAREVLGAGTIGKPLWADFWCAQCNAKPAYRRDGVILNWSHEIDLAVHLLGYAEVECCSANDDESIADLTIVHTHNKCRTRIHLDYVTDPEQRGFRIVGDMGVLEVDLVARHLVVTNRTLDAFETYGGRDTFDGNYLDEMRKFIERCHGEITIGCTATEAFNVMNLCLRAKEFAGGSQKEDISGGASPYGVYQVTGKGDDAARQSAGVTLDHQRSQTGEAD